MVFSRNLQAVTGPTFERGAQLHVDIVFSNKQPQMFNKFLDFCGARNFSTVLATAYLVRRRVWRFITCYQVLGQGVVRPQRDSPYLLRTLSLSATV
jgi:hypothetical protein